MTTEEKISKTLMDNGRVSYPYPVFTPRFLRWIGIKTVNLTFTDLHLGTLLIVSPLIAKLSTGIKDDKVDSMSLLAHMGENVKLQAEIIAIAMLNNPFKIKAWTWIVKRFLKWNVSAKNMSILAGIVLEKTNIMDFMRSIVLTAGLQTQKAETSPASDTGEIIAPGSGSEM